MINLEEYYTFPADAVEYITVTESGNDDYKYTLTVYLKSGHKLPVLYRTKDDCVKAKYRLIMNIEREQNQELEKMKYELYLIKDCVKRIDKRQLRIWQQLRDLLNIPKEENNV